MKIKELVNPGYADQEFPLGITRTQGGIHIAAVAHCQACSLVLYEKSRKKERAAVFPFRAERRVGDVWSMDLTGEDLDELVYCFEADKKELPDPFARAFAGREKWGDMEAAKKLPLALIAAASPAPNAFFDWEGDRALHIPYEDTVIYRLHVRGFTGHASSGVKNRGTFHGIIEKIPYLKDLGITAVELMPPYEFQEVMLCGKADGCPCGQGEPSGRINFWGYGPGFYFAPKASYSSGRLKDPVNEFKTLVKELHKNGIELLAELYFPENTDPFLVREAARFWVREYHADGLHLTGYADARLLCTDPYLASVKLLAASWSEGSSGARVLGEYNDGFQTEMRRFLKGDEDQLNALVYRSRRNPQDFGVINYMANTNGFTMMDMVSYERKHNEANGEDNRDGSGSNCSWNCGVEGQTRKKKVLRMRRQQLCNAFLILLLSQGTPLILAGDEFGRSQGGNNNAYCQDNEVSWLNWKLLSVNRDLYEFVRYLIAFRKAHPVFHMKQEPLIMDYRACGYPDVSYHGVRAWRPEFESFRRELGILYCGAYAEKEDGEPDDYFYVAYNMHWEPHEFDLPNPPKGMLWHVAVNTDAGENLGVYPEGDEPCLNDKKRFCIAPRTIVIFIGRNRKDRNKNEEELA